MRDKLKWGMGGLILGAIGFWILLAFGFGWMSASSAQNLADTQTHDAIVAYASGQCVVRFEQQKPEIMLADWQKLQAAQSGSNSYEFDAVKFLKKTPVGGQNLLALPGQELPDSIADDVATSCTDALTKLKKVGTLTFTMPRTNVKKS